MGKICENCGGLKKTTFNCKKCGKVVCLDCYVFTNSLCVNCDVDNYIDNYDEKIKSYAQ